ncbi:MAG: acyl-CoA desaturase [Verrucomicrobiota bacterium]
MQNSDACQDAYSSISVTRVILFHLSSLFVFVVGWSPVALLVFVLTFFVRLFSIAGGYHRYFSHRSFKTSRWFQFVLALVGTTTGQKGPLSWASSHRDHHRYADTPEDPHSPVIHGWFHAHLGWVLKKRALPTSEKLLKEYSSYPEIEFLNKFHYLGFLVYLIFLYLLGFYLNSKFPELRTSGGQLLIWGGVLSTLFLLHGTCMTNSLTHLIGREDYKTDDSSKNLSWLYFFTFGENWHNTHHKFPGSANTGIRKGQIDFIYIMILALEKLGIVWDVQKAGE